MLSESLQPSRDSRHDNRNDHCARWQFTLRVAGEICHGLAGIKVFQTGLMQIDPNAHNGAGTSPGNSSQIDQNSAEFAVTAPKIIRSLETHRSPAQMSETVGHRHAD